ncbi:hypothetical protein [Flavobacterium sp.]|jgi:hypothetical protein|uniref:hypothetical protein n=1 Tax=Flavobacterium sp. TaxID=239 RepID=UPI0037BFAF92
MKNKILFLFVGLLFVVSCGKEEKQENSNIKNPVEITIEHKYSLNDTFKVFYSKDINAPIDGTSEMTTQVIGTDGFQKTTFVLPIGDYPKVIRLDVGNNQDAESIEIKGIQITHGDAIIDNSDWITTTNWAPNNSLVVDTKSPNMYKIVPVDGKKGPVFMSNIVVNEKLNKYFKGK